MEISKELIIKVMDIKYPFSDVQLNSNILSWWREDVFFEETVKINIYEFAFKCKEWARDKYNITISSALYRDYAKSWNVDKDKSYTAKTEVEVIIKACEWLLEETNDNKNI